MLLAIKIAVSVEFFRVFKVFRFWVTAYFFTSADALFNDVLLHHLPCNNFLLPTVK